MSDDKDYNLTDKQEKFLKLFRKGLDPKEAARQAGYSEYTAHDVYRNILQSEGIQAALKDHANTSILKARQEILEYSDRAIEVVKEILDNNEVKEKDRLKAAEMLLNRSDELKETLGIEVDGEVEHSGEVTVNKLHEWAKEYEGNED